jgi:hypothetical protein
VNLSLNNEDAGCGLYTVGIYSTVRRKPIDHNEFCGERVALGFIAVGVSPASRSASVLAKPGSDVSIPFAVPDREPASGTMSIGARARFSCPDLMRLFVTDSLLRYIQ